MATRNFSNAYFLGQDVNNLQVGTVYGQSSIAEADDGGGDNLYVVGDIPTDIFDGNPGLLGSFTIRYLGESGDDIGIIGDSNGDYYLFTDEVLSIGDQVNYTNTAFIVAPDTQNTLPAGPLSASEDISSSITGLSIADTDAQAAGRSVTTTLTVVDGTLNVSSILGGASVSGSGTGNVTLTGTVTEINATLSASNSVTYTGGANLNGSDSLQVVTIDNGNGSTEPASSDTDTVTINVAAVNDAPVATVPATIAVTEDTATAITGISFADVDAGSASVTVTLSVTSGALSATSTSGVIVSGSATALTLTGSLTDINTFIAVPAVTFTPAANSTTDVTLTTTISDGGNTGTGGSLTDTETTTLDLTAVNDAPVITSNAGGSAATVSYAENGTGAVTTVTSTDIDGPTATYSVTGTDAALFSIDAVTGVLSFVSSPNFEAPADAGRDNAYNVDVNVTDGALAATQSLTINVTDVNEPVPSTPPVLNQSTDGPDSLQGTNGADTIAGGLSNDTIAGGLGDDDLNGNQGDDILNGNQGEDLVHGGRGNDQVYGGMGNDQLFGDRGNDVVYGGQGNDNINGNQGNDLVNGNQGNDTVHGGQGDDEVRGGQGDDMVFGDFGNDQVWGDLGNDTLSGGAGADTFHFAANSGNDVIVDFSRADGDKLDFGGQTFTVADVNGSTVFTLSGGGTVVLTGMSSTTMDASDFV